MPTLPERAAAARDAIADALVERIAHVDHPSLCAGLGGIAVALRALGRDEAEAAMERAVELIGAHGLDGSWFHGLAGIGAALELLGADAELCEPLDDALGTYLDAAAPTDGAFDLGGGWSGVVAYLAGRVGRANVEAQLARALELLRAAAVPFAGGVAWRNRGGRIDLGMAHGLAGTIAALSDLGARGADLLEPAVTALIASARPEDPAHGLRSFDGDSHAARLAWCYGDLGAGAALVRAGDALDRADWRAAGLAIARRAAERGDPDGRVVDAGLCHGAAGIAHVLARFGLAEQARPWVVRALDLRDEGAAPNLAGYRAWEPSPPAEVAHFIADPCLLTGVAGIALAFDAALGGDAWWDRALLLRGPA